MLAIVHMYITATFLAAALAIACENVISQNI